MDLRTCGEKCKLLVRGTHGLLFTADRRGRITFVNEEGASALGFAPDELVGRVYLQLVDEEDRGNVHTLFSRVLKMGTDENSVEFQYRGKNQKTGWVVLSMSPVIESEEVVGFAAVGVDITDRKRAERELESRLRQQAAVSALGDRALEIVNITSLMDEAAQLITESLGVEFSAVFEVLPDQSAFHLRSGVGWREGHVGRTTVPMVREYHTGYTFLQRAPVAVEDFQSEARFGREPLLDEHSVMSGISIAIRQADHPVGILGVYSGKRHEFSGHDLNFLQAVANVLAGAFNSARFDRERAQLSAREHSARAEADAAKHRLSFLLKASTILSESLDYRTTLVNVAKLAVPTFADWCVVDILEEVGLLSRVAIEHPDPLKKALAHEIARWYPPNPDSSRGIMKVLRTGMPELYSEITDSVLAEVAHDAGHLTFLRGLHLRSAMIIPLTARGTTLGAITFASAESAGSYAEEDMLYAQDLARRMAVGIDNAQLYRAAETSLRDIESKSAEIERLNEELEERVKERTTQLEAANTELESFSYSVSHDLRAPLRAIDGFSRILVEQYAESLGAEGHRLLTLVRDNTKKMGALIDDLLRFSRFGRIVMTQTDTDMLALAKSVMEELLGSSRPGKLRFRTRPLPKAHGDESLFRQVFANLLSNALKFTKPQRTAVIEVGGWEAEGENVYYVKDNGVGFDMRYADKLFSVFQRLHPEEEFEGTGVGLAIVQRIIHRHGGRVWAEGKPQEGATFYFSLPRSRPIYGEPS